MIRKLKLHTVVVERVQALHALLSTTHDTAWPPAWADLERHARLALDAAHEEQSVINSYIEALTEYPSVAAEETSDDTSELSFESLDLTVDLVALMDDPEDGVTALRTLTELMIAVRDGEHHTLDLLKLGARRATVDEAIAAFEEIAQSYGLTLALEESPDVDFGESEESTKGHDDGDDDDEWSDDDTSEPGSDSAAPRKPNARIPSSARVTGRYTQRAGSFGGLDDEEPAPRAPNVPHGAGSFADAEHFFLAQTSLSWPTSPEMLRQQWRMVIHIRHPDRASDDPTAHASFVLLKEGYQRLMRRLGESP